MMQLRMDNLDETRSTIECQFVFATFPVMFIYRLILLLWACRLAIEKWMMINFSTCQTLKRDEQIWYDTIRLSTTYTRKWMGSGEKNWPLGTRNPHRTFFSNAKTFWPNTTQFFRVDCTDDVSHECWGLQDFAKWVESVQRSESCLYPLDRNLRVHGSGLSNWCQWYGCCCSRHKTILNESRWLAMSDMNRQLFSTRWTDRHTDPWS
jgi:hypothetical protein